jgi:hypothetical protein
MLVLLDMVVQQVIQSITMLILLREKIVGEDVEAVETHAMLVERLVICQENAQIKTNRSHLEEEEAEVTDKIQVMVEEIESLVLEEETGSQDMEEVTDKKVAMEEDLIESKITMIMLLVKTDGILQLKM